MGGAVVDGAGHGAGTTLPVTGGRGWKIVGRTGLVISGLMAIPNTLNGGLQVLGSRETSSGGTIPIWVGASLLAAGLIVLAATVPAWRGSTKAIWAVAIARFSEISALLVFVDAFPAEEGEKPFYVVLSVVSVVVGLMVLCLLKVARRG